jgi:Bacteriophage clamp loader A subunit
MSPFDFVNAINTSKKDLIRESEAPDLMEKQYSPFLVNRALSYFIDTILYANEMNRVNHVDSKLQNDYYLNSIRSAKRFSKWSKPVENSDIESIQEYYKVNYNRALEISKVLTKEQLDLIRIKIIKGGNHVQLKPVSGSEAKER